MNSNNGRNRYPSDHEKPEEFVKDILSSRRETGKENVKRRHARIDPDNTATKTPSHKVPKLSPPVEAISRAKSRSTSGEPYKSTDTETVFEGEGMMMEMSEEEENSKRLEVIDKLYALGIGQYISLPQIVVVGDQSSGKSSVLEGITGLPFPRDSELCTRFPTQVIFERSLSSKVEVSFIDSSKETECTTFRRDELNAAVLKKVFKEAHGHVGISTSTSGKQNNGKSNFSAVTLRIKVLGPTNQHFSVLDLPGLFRKPTEGKSTAEDMKLVRSLVEKAMSNERSIVMAVTPANVDAATQEILQLAVNYDQHHQRTLAVLTKPDIVDEGTENRILDFAKSQRYSVVCNRSQKYTNISNEERNMKELEFFERSPWCTLPQELKGISSLKQRLFTILDTFAQEEFPKLGAELSDKIANVEEQLMSLGEVRITSEQQRMFLLKTATEFQQISCNAVDAAYHRNKCLMSNTTLKLATSIVNISEDFEERIRREGHQWRFSGGKKQAFVFPSAFPQPTKETTKPTESEHKTGENNVPSPWSSYFTNYPELRNIVKLSTSLRSPKDNIGNWIKTEHLSYRSMEVGNSNSSLLPSLFSEQSTNWKIIAQHYVSTAIYTVHNFIKTLLDHVCRGNDDIRNRIWHKLKPLLLMKYKKAMDHTDFLIQVESQGHMFTLNHYFAENLKKVRAERHIPPQSETANVTPGIFGPKTDPMTATPGGMFGTKPNPTAPTMGLFGSVGVMTPPASLHANSNNGYISNIDSEVQDIHDILQAYYKVARKRFVDAVCKQAVDHFLICSADGPLKIFSPEFIGGMDNKTLDEIAGERSRAKEIRARLTEKLNKLREGQDLLAY